MTICCINTVPAYVRPTEASGPASQGVPDSEGETQGSPTDSLPLPQTLSFLTRTPLRHLRYAPSDELVDHQLTCSSAVDGRARGVKILILILRKLLRLCKLEDKRGLLVPRWVASRKRVRKMWHGWTINPLGPHPMPEDLMHPARWYESF